MSSTRLSKGWHIDLIGAVISGVLIGNLGQRESDTGEIRSLKVYTFSMLLAVNSYLVVFLLLNMWKRNHKIPSWILIAIFGSILCAITYRLPVNDMYLDGIFVGLLIFSLVALTIMGLGRFIYILAKR